MDPSSSWSPQRTEPSGKECDSEILSQLRHLIEDEENLKCPLNDEFLIKFIRARKYDVVRAFQLLKKYFIAKHQLLTKSTILPSTNVEILSEHYTILLNQKDLEGRQILLFRIGEWDTNKYTLDNIFSSTFLILDQLISTSEEIQLNGLSVLVDLHGFGLRHASQCGIKQSRRIVEFIQDSFPLRVKSVHVVNNSRIFTMVYEIAKQFMTNKMKSRYHFHGYDCKSLHSHLQIQPEILPPSLGGSCTMLNQDFEDFLSRLMDNEHFYTELSKCGFISE